MENTHTHTQFFLCISFILCIVLITLYYKNNKYNNIELFYNTTIPNRTISPSNLPRNTENNSRNSTSSNQNNVNKYFTDNDISNIYVKQALNNTLSDIDTIFDNYTTINPGININNDGTTCDNWGTYNNNEFSPLSNNCEITSNSNKPQCLSNNKITSCSKYFADNVVNDYTTIDVQILKNNIISDILTKSGEIITELNDKTSKSDTLLNNLNTQLNIENQQSFFITNNTYNIDDKKKIINKTTEEYDKDENDILINKINFSNFLEQNSNNDRLYNIYYKIIIGLIITLIIIGIINLLSSKEL